MANPWTAEAKHDVMAKIDDAQVEREPLTLSVDEIDTLWAEILRLRRIAFHAKHAAHA